MTLNNLKNNHMSIIAINGKIGSGKDTVGQLIQELRASQNWQIKKFAGKLKQIATLLTNIPIDNWEDQSFKQTYLGDNWGMTARDFLQKIGTESLRNGLHENVWVNALFSEYIPLNEELRRSMGNVLDYSDCIWPNWIITDLRFPNELEAVTKRRGITIKIIRESENRIGTTHISETALDDYTNWDYVIYNNGTIEDLRTTIQNILIERNL